MTINYGGFLMVSTHAANEWKDKVIEDPECFYYRKKVKESDKEILKQLGKSKTASPLIIVDPVEAKRNAAAAVSKEKFNLAKNVCKKFLLKPSIEFSAIYN